MNPWEGSVIAMNSPTHQYNDYHLDYVVCVLPVCTCKVTVYVAHGADKCLNPLISLIEAVVEIDRPNRVCNHMKTRQYISIVSGAPLGGQYLHSSLFS